MKVNTTRHSLLTKVRKGDEIAWDEFYTTYFPFIDGVLRKRISDKGERENLCQDIFIVLFKNDTISKYNSKKGKFRTFLYTIVWRRTNDWLRKKYKNKEWSNDEFEKYLTEEEGLFEKTWKDEYNQHILDQALKEVAQKVEPITFQSFELYAIDNNSADEVAGFLNISKNEVYVNKNSVVN